MMRAQECEDGGFVLSQAVGLPARQAPGTHIGVDHRRVDIALPADRDGIAQTFGNAGHDRRDGAFGGARAGGGSQAASSLAHSTVPAQVRNSLAVMSRPLTVRKYALMSDEVMACNAPSSS